jgi:hypothetical protein
VEEVVELVLLVLVGVVGGTVSGDAEGDGDGVDSADLLLAAANASPAACIGDSGEEARTGVDGRVCRVGEVTAEAAAEAKAEAGAAAEEL